MIAVLFSHYPFGSAYLTSFYNHLTLVDWITFWFSECCNASEFEQNVNASSFFLLLHLVLMLKNNFY